MLQYMASRLSEGGDGGLATRCSTGWRMPTRRRESFVLPFNPAKMFEDRRIVAFEEEETNFYYYPKGHGNEGQVYQQP